MRGHYSDIWQAVARAFPERPAVVTPGGVLTYGRMHEEAGALARHLDERGIRAGDAVAILLYNRAEYVVTLFACLATGVVPVPLNYRYRAPEVRALLEDSGARTLLYAASLTETVREATEGWAEAPGLIVIDDAEQAVEPIAGGVTWEQAIAVAGELPAAPPPDGELWIYTGGTTGRPKAVVWGADEILSVQLYSIYGTVGMALPETMDDVLAVASDPGTPRVTSLPLAPFMHGTALFTSMNTLALGGTVCVLDSPRFDADATVRFAVETGATRIVVAGDAIALPLVEAVERAGLERFGQVDSVISSGMRFSPQVKRRLHERGPLTITDLLASTEGGPYAVNVTTSAEDVPGRLRLLPGAVVLDEELREVQDVAGAKGLLGFRGTLPRGYYGDEEKTRATFPVIDGVRHVMAGDWAVTKGDGTVELLGRGSAVVNTGGEKVYPVEIEEALMEFPPILDAVVIGMPDPRYGEVVTAVVVTQGGADVDAEALRAHLDARLAGYKKPRHLFVRETLGRSPHGKIDLPGLKAELAAELERAGAPTDAPRAHR
ncbi:AMP-binding protein [Microbacterium caowuchunii]|uniref:AMP-binding protein n=1 Tax=Microbacterium caowuchunii TaxID=2614638 RepID=A0A5N0TIC9_9MICO|nr:AMP-binding protein [Microbacterium caowuchunii]KAA9134258.1 AMP-binding protein [Microbacterium caowuchunii]